MKAFQDVLKKVFCPSVLDTILIVLVSFSMLLCAVILRLDGIVIYGVYVLSAYALTVMVTGVIRLVTHRHLRRICDHIKHPLNEKLRSHPLGKRYFTDLTFQVQVTLYPSLILNILYSGMKMFSGILYGSIWLIILSVYYLLLAVIRFLILIGTWKNIIGSDPNAEWKCYRICGMLLGLMTLALSGMILFIVQQNGNYQYPGILIYLMAIYTFYAVISAAVNLRKFRKHGSPMLLAAKAASLTAALVSMLALETAMLIQFGTEEEHVMRPVMIAVTGAVVCGLIWIMAVYMVVRATKQLKKL